MSMLMRLCSGFKGRKVGTDRHGNLYFESRNVVPGFNHTRRWVVYSGRPHATPQLDENRRYPWQLDHQPNMTGTALAHRPPGHDYKGGERPKTAGDYEAWTPGA